MRGKHPPTLRPGELTSLKRITFMVRRVIVPVFGNLWNCSEGFCSRRTYDCVSDFKAGSIRLS